MRISLQDFVALPAVPAPWAEGDNIPWDEPDFSERMLREHLSQEHDAASRRTEKIDRHVAWIHEEVLQGRPARVLDLGCGPGFYLERLARLGHQCVGLDYAPAAIAYAKKQAEVENLACEYRQGDLRTLEYGTGFDLVMQIYGELNVFSPDDVRIILRRACEALRPDGRMLVEPTTFEVVKREGESPPSWRALDRGLFSDAPHLWLEQYHWHSGPQVSATRHVIINAATGQVTLYGMSRQAYTQEQLTALLESCGFAGVEFFPCLTGASSADPYLMVALAGRSERLERDPP